MKYFPHLMCNKRHNESNFIEALVSNVWILVTLGPAAFVLKAYSHLPDSSFTSRIIYDINHLIMCSTFPVNFPFAVYLGLRQNNYHNAPSGCMDVLHVWEADHTEWYDVDNAAITKSATKHGQLSSLWEEITRSSYHYLNVSGAKAIAKSICMEPPPLR